MKNIKLLLLILSLSTTAQAAGLITHLVDINDRWAYEQAAWARVPDEACHSSEGDLIQQHLLLVHEELKSRNVEELSSEEALNRKEGLENLLRYAERGLFPQNITHIGRRPIFIDHSGVHCAVGYLIKESGNPSLSKHISFNMNDAYLLDMSDPALEYWVAESGFTPEELAWIQPGYFQPVNYAPLKGGVDGPVFSIVEDFTGGIFAAGLFDSADGMAAGSIANYFSGFAGFDWMPIGGSGITGQVYDMEYHNGNLYVAGDFYAADTVGIASGVAMWNGTKWTAIGEFYIGALPNYVRDIEVYRDTLYAGGLLRSKVSSPETFFGLAKWDGTEWRATAADLSGEVKALHVQNGKLVVAGNFIMNDTSLTNIFMLNGNTAEYFNAPVEVPINDVDTMGGELFIATDFYNQSRLDSLGVAVYRNQKWDRIFGPEHSPGKSDGAVKCLQSYKGHLFIGGDFVINPILGNYGKNIGVYSGNGVRAFGMVDSSVCAISTIGDQMYIGGYFNGATTSTGGVRLNHIAEVYIPDYLSSKELKGEEFDVFPNPAKDKITVNFKEGLGNNVEILLFDVSGKKFPVTPVRQGKTVLINTSELSRGTYIIQVKSNEGHYQEKIIFE